MKRREFITLLGGAAAAWPVGARAQQRERMRRIGVLLSAAANAPEAQPRIIAFVQGLAQLEWNVGHNVQIDLRWGGGNADDIHKYAVELAALAPDVILASSTAAVAALMQATSHGADRVRTSHRPGGGRLGRQLGPAGPQRHRVHDFRIRLGWEMAGTAQADRAGRDASSRSSGCSRNPASASSVRSSPWHPRSGWS